MADLNQKLGFDASGAIAQLAQLATSLKTTGAALTTFAAQAQRAGSGSFTAQMAAGTQAVDKATASYLGMGKAASTAAKQQTAAGVAGAKAGKAVANAWGIAIRIVATQLISRTMGNIVQLFGEATEAAREFGLAIAEVATLSGQALGSQAELSTQVLRLSDAFGQAATDVAEGLYQTLSNQVVDASESFRFLTQAMKLARATASETRDAVNALSSVINSYNLSAGDASRISDQLFKTVELGRLRLEEIGNVMGRVTPLTAKLGISFEEVAGAIAVQTRQGVQANTALTQLRAVVQKLIKPTDKLKDVFRKWGVEDGPTAIKTFGGLQGVLKKLALEVDNNDAEMAQFFNRVRAISAQMGLMTDNGEELRKTIEEIGEATGATNKAFSEFVGAPAFELTKAQNEYNNALIKTGEALTGVATTWNKLKTNFLTGVRVLTDGFDNEFAVSIEKIAAINEATNKAIQEGHKENTKSLTDELNKQVEGTRQALAQVNQAWNAAVDDALGQSKRLKASIGEAFKGLNEDFRNSFAGLSDFVKNAADQIKGARAQAKGLRQELEQRQFDRGLEGLSAERQFSQLFNRAAENFAKARKQLDQATTKEQKELADELFKAGRAEAERANKLAESNNLTRQMRSVNTLIDESLKFQADSLERYAARAESYYDIATKAEQKLTEIAAEREEIGKRLVSLYSDLERALDPAAQTELLNEINKAVEELDSLDVTADAGKFMDSLNIPNAAAEVGKQVDEALDQVSIDWTATIEDLQNRLAQVKVDLRAQVPGGQAAIDSAEAQLGRPQKALEGDAAFINQALKETIELRQQAQNAAQALGDAEIQQAANTQKAAIALEQLNRTASPGIFGVAGGPLEAQTLPALRDLAAGYQEINALIQAGQPLDQQKLEALRQQAEKFFSLEHASTQAKAALSQMEAAVRDYVSAANLIQEQQTLMDQAALNANNTLLQDIAQNTRSTSEAMSQVSQATQQSAQSAGQFNSAMQSSAGVTGTLVSGWNQVAAATQRAAQAAVQAIQAIAQARAAAASATAFHGGRIDYLASGGQTQGQDTINAMLAPGEFVVNSKATKSFFSELNAMNNGGQPVFREQGGEVTNVGDINITVQGGDTSQQTVREIGNALRRDIRRGVVKLN